MMRWLLIAVALIVLPAACSREDARAVPAPHSLTADATGHYCGMLLSEHAGPKGQILLKGKNAPVWFTSVRDTLTFLALPEEAKDIAAVYVSDMAKALNWDQPGADNWMLANAAFFVIESERQGGMGGAEAVPFSTETAAQTFVGQYHGRIVSFDEAAKTVAAGGLAGGANQ
jgi:nitrous oxide reductase accessory protein NosL